MSNYIPKPNFWLRHWIIPATHNHLFGGEEPTCYAIPTKEQIPFLLNFGEKKTSNRNVKKYISILL